jgi:hypothetical protein
LLTTKQLTVIQVKVMNPWQAGMFMRRFSQWSLNILSVFMVASGVYLAFSGDDQDDRLIGATNILLGTSLLSMVEDEPLRR